MNEGGVYFWHFLKIPSLIWPYLTKQYNTNIVLTSQFSYSRMPRDESKFGITAKSTNVQ